MERNHNFSGKMPISDYDIRLFLFFIKKLFLIYFIIIIFLKKASLFSPLLSSILPIHPKCDQIIWTNHSNRSWSRGGGREILRFWFLHRFFWFFFFFEVDHGRLQCLQVFLAFLFTMVMELQRRLAISIQVFLPQNFFDGLAC